MPPKRDIDKTSCYEVAKFSGYKELRAMNAKERNDLTKLLSGWGV